MILSASWVAPDSTAAGPSCGGRRGGVRRCGEGGQGGDSLVLWVPPPELGRHGALLPLAPLLRRRHRRPHALDAWAYTCSHFRSS